MVAVTKKGKRELRISVKFEDAVKAALETPPEPKKKAKKKRKAN
jgi:hypothetical protein